ncbi:hypothetical protein NOF55_19250 [Rhizobiaceae bacterium BDR2-2]|uniref:Uncharacterized protein n=1 Tax=Ectorhizobium quercum TaxID=2965071 RepID=A0AAE3SWD0_9HYPH|nr:hypothetical protein [Ectorhizobium quercum]MCX8999245.1 hypothetical protein [Ectorhizobium quercum]
MRTRRTALMAAALACLAALPAATASAGSVSGSGLPSVTRWGDTYAGAASTAGTRHGTYFHLDRKTRPAPAAERQEKRTRPPVVIGAEPECSYEAGVCVIRP